MVASLKPSRTAAKASDPHSVMEWKVLMPSQLWDAGSSSHRGVEVGGTMRSAIAVGVV